MLQAASQQSGWYRPPYVPDGKYTGDPPHLKPHPHPHTTPPHPTIPTLSLIAGRFLTIPPRAPARAGGGSGGAGEEWAGPTWPKPDDEPSLPYADFLKAPPRTAPYPPPVLVREYARPPCG